MIVFIGEWVVGPQPDGVSDAGFRGADREGTTLRGASLLPERPLDGKAVDYRNSGRRARPLQRPRRGPRNTRKPFRVFSVFRGPKAFLPTEHTGHTDAAQGADDAPPFEQFARFVGRLNPETRNRRSVPTQNSKPRTQNCAAAAACVSWAPAAPTGANNHSNLPTSRKKRSFMRSRNGRRRQSSSRISSDCASSIA